MNSKNTSNGDILSSKYYHQPKVRERSKVQCVMPANNLPYHVLCVHSLLSSFEMKIKHALFIECDGGVGDIIVYLK